MGQGRSANSGIRYIASLGASALSICIIFASPALAGSSSPKANPQTEEAAESLRSVLEDAKRNGLIKSETSSVAVTAPNDEAETEADPVKGTSTQGISCQQAERLLDVSLFESITNYDDLSGYLSEVNDERLATRVRKMQIYLAAGLAEEVDAVTNDTSIPEIAFLQDAAILLSTGKTDKTASFSALSDCAVHLLPWAILADQDFDFLYGDHDTKYLLLSSLDDLPDGLERRITEHLAVRAVDQGERMFVKQVMTQLSDLDGPGSVFENDHAIYVNARLMARARPGQSLARLRYLAERDGPFQLHAIEALSELPDPEVKTEQSQNLKSLHHRTGQSEFQEDVSVALFKNRLDAGDLHEATNIIREDFGSASGHFQYLVGQLISVISLRLDANDIGVRLGGVDNYINAKDLVSGHPDDEDLRVKVIATAIDLGFPEIVNSIVNNEPSIEEGLSHFTRELIALKKGQFPDNTATQFTDDQVVQLAKSAAELALVTADFESAKIWIDQLPDDETRKRLHTELLIHVRAWAYLRQQENKPVSNEILDFLSRPKRVNSQLSMRSSQSAQAIIADFGEEIEQVRRYLSDG